MQRIPGAVANNTVVFEPVLTLERANSCICQPPKFTIRHKSWGRPFGVEQPLYFANLLTATSQQQPHDVQPSTMIYKLIRSYPCISVNLPPGFSSIEAKKDACTPAYGLPGEEQRRFQFLQL
jgi:hypothetical protein